MAVPKKQEHPSSTFNQDQIYTRSFRSLSARDLLDARDQFHVHLVNKENVIATAIGLYLIRDDDPDARDHTKGAEAMRDRGKLEPRKLTNSSSRPWSWPCILVFVNRWQSLDELRHHPESVVPPFLYLEDGRIVPVCVVLATASELPPRTIDPARMMADSLEGGSPVFTESQGQSRMGTIACIVSDGTDYFALTNRHVAGEAGRQVKAMFRGLQRVIGTSAATNLLDEVAFSEIYPSLPGRETVVHLDAGLVHIDNVADWRATVGGKTVGPMANFSADTASLDWIGTRLVAHGAASGELSGEVRALFYRYKSVGGREYISEFLIGNRTPEPNARRNHKPQPLMTRPGDSGALWCVDPELTGGVLRPVAMEWGGHRLGDDPRSLSYLQFALASSVAVICRELALDVVSDFRAEHTQYWGAVGHFKIAQQACLQVADEQLRQFLVANLDNISFTDNNQLLEATHLQAAHFVPLSDVPDIVWKTNVNRVNRAVTRAQENWNHFADMDLPGEDGKTLLDMFAANPSSLQWSTWHDFYASAPHPSAAKTKPLSHGSLPFRVWQIFSFLQQLPKKPANAAQFLCAAGIMAHYVGDACQPLHCSQHADGLNGASTGVHSTYEDNMVERFADQIATGIDQVFQSEAFKPTKIADGHNAGIEVVRLMQRCHQALPPESICDSYNRARPGDHKSPTKSAAVLEAMWHDCGQGTIACIADGIRTLASLWQAAAGDDASWLTKKFDGETQLRKIYEDTTFLPSFHLEHYTQTMIPGSDAPKTAAATSGTANPPRKKPAKAKKKAKAAQA